MKTVRTLRAFAPSRLSFAAAAVAIACATSGQAMAQQAPHPEGFRGFSISAVAGAERSVVDGFGTDSSTGAVYGGQVGFDIRRNHVVFGAEAEVTDASTNSTLDFLGITIRTEHGLDLYGGVRAGYVVGRVLVYAKGGYTNARIDSETSSPFITGARSHHNDQGYRIGAGVEAAIAPHISVKAEYRFSDYGEDFQRSQLVTGVTYRF